VQARASSVFKHPPLFHIHFISKASPLDFSLLPTPSQSRSQPTSQPTSQSRLPCRRQSRRRSFFAIPLFFRRPSRSQSRSQSPFATPLFFKSTFCKAPSRQTWPRRQPPSQPRLRCRRQPRRQPPQAGPSFDTFMLFKKSTSSYAARPRKAPSQKDVPDAHAHASSARNPPAIKLAQAWIRRSVSDILWSASSMKACDPTTMARLP
jgi:hypothetical protein